MDKCPDCGQFGSIDDIALASGPLSELRARRCDACGRFWVSCAEIDVLGDDGLFGASARGVATPTERRCRACGGMLKALPEPAGVFSCEACRLLLMDERSYDELELEKPA
ncbi:MAG: hypothetical protein NTY77_07650 [Elusimicrobia bacterium]|nr:hypothetical protein [Elusimicrobiota bacterium]